MTWIETHDPLAPDAVDIGPEVARPRSASRLGYIGYPLLAGGIAVASLEFVHRSGWVHPIAWPSPFSVFVAMYHQMSTSEMWENLWITIQEAWWGFLLGSAIGFVAGTGIAMSRFVSRALYPFTVLFYSMPIIAFAPVFVALFGFGRTPKVLMAAAICFFPVLVNTVTGFRNVGEDEVSLMRSMCAPRRQIFWRLLVPTALPSIFGGLKTTMTLAFLGAIVGEFTSANEGIGLLVNSAAIRLDMDRVFGYIIWLALTSLVLFPLIDRLAKRIVFWTES